MSARWQVKEERANVHGFAVVVQRISGPCGWGWRVENAAILESYGQCRTQKAARAKAVDAAGSAKVEHEKVKAQLDAAVSSLDE